MYTSHLKQASYGGTTSVASEAVGGPSFEEIRNKGKPVLDYN